MDIDQNELRVYTLEESAAILRCEPAWLDEQATQGKAPYADLGGARRFTSGHLAEILSIREKRPTRGPGATSASARLTWNAVEAGLRLSCTATWLREQARNNRIPYTKLSGSYCFTDEHLIEIIRIFEVRPHRPASPPQPSAARRHPVLPPPVPGREPVLLKPREPRKRGRRSTDLRRTSVRDTRSGM
jgi:hypothetical protein